LFLAASRLVVGRVHTGEALEPPALSRCRQEEVDGRPGRARQAGEEHARPLQSLDEQHVVERVA